MRIAIVTGASSGLGAEFARQLDTAAGAGGDVDEIWLVARRADRLEQLAASLKHARGRVLAMDLTDRRSLDTLEVALREAGADVRWLVNNAGYGRICTFETGTAADWRQMIDLNVTAVVDLTHRALPWCRDGAHIVQVASSAGFSPMVNFAVYAATKSFVVNFSNAIAWELRKRGITVTAVCPGPVDTEFFEVAVEKAGQRRAKVGGFFWARPEAVVRKALRDSRRGVLNSVYGLPIWLWTAVAGWIPRPLVLLSTAIAKRERLS